MQEVPSVWEQDLGCNYRVDVAIEIYDVKVDKQKIHTGKNANRGVTEAHEC